MNGLQIVTLTVLLPVMSNYVIYITSLTHAQLIGVWLDYTCHYLVRHGNCVTCGYDVTYVGGVSGQWTWGTIRHHVTSTVSARLSPHKYSPKQPWARSITLHTRTSPHCVQCHDRLYRVLRRGIHQCNVLQPFSVCFRSTRKTILLCVCVHVHS